MTRETDLRFAMNLANAALVRVAENGEMTGRAVEIAHHVATALGRRPVFRQYDTAASVIAGAGNEWDVAFLAIDPTRTAAVAFTRPYLAFDVGCAVRLDSNLTDAVDIDGPGLRVACGRGGYAAQVRQRITQATIVDMARPVDALDALETGAVDVAVGLVPALEIAAAASPIRLLNGVIARVEHALAVPVGQKDRLPLLDDVLRAL